ncbi:hypothetical protein Tco_1204827 [Tanacetum coccineum]
MVWKSVSLRYETGEKKVNEVDFISQGVELVSRILTTMTKTRVQLNLSIRGRMNWLMVVNKIEGELLEEMEESHFEKKMMILEWMSCASILVLPTFLVFWRSLDGGLSKTLMVGVQVLTFMKRVLTNSKDNIGQGKDVLRRRRRVGTKEFFIIFINNVMQRMR